MVYIYGLHDPRNGELRYIGKAKDIPERLLTHIKDAKRSNTPKNTWILSLKEQGLTPEIRQIEEVQESEWQAAERKWIAFHRAQGVPLKNIDDGGRGRSGYVVSAETRRKLSAAGKGRKLTDAQRQKLIDANTGRKLSIAVRKKISASHTGKKMSDAARNNMSLSSKGRKKSAEHRRKIGVAHTGRVFSEETRAKMSTAKQGWQPPAELTAIQREKCRGVGNGRARLTEKQVIEIRQRYAIGNISLPKLAEDYPVTFSAIHRIVKRKTWTHLP